MEYTALEVQAGIYENMRMLSDLKVVEDTMEQSGEICQMGGCQAAARGRDFITENIFKLLIKREPPLSIWIKFLRLSCRGNKTLRRWASHVGD